MVGHGDEGQAIDVLVHVTGNLALVHVTGNLAPTPVTAVIGEGLDQEGGPHQETETEGNLVPGRLKSFPAPPTPIYPPTPPPPPKKKGKKIKWQTTHFYSRCKEPKY